MKINSPETSFLTAEHGVADLQKNAPFLDAGFQDLTGMALRPGGLELTRELLAQAEQLRRWNERPKALDVGCGAGLSLELLLGRGYAVTGLDPCPDMLALAVRRTKGQASLIPGLAEELDLPAADFDLLLCECVLSLCHDPKQALRRMWASLKPGGIMILTDICLREAGPPGPAGGCLAGAVSQETMLARLVDAGFAIVSETDYSRKLAELTAKLIFAGQAAKLGHWLGLDCHPGQAPLRAFGYRAWLASACRLDSRLHN